MRRFARHLEQRGLSPASVVKYLCPLKTMYADAVDDGAVQSNPAAGLRVNGRRDEAAEEPEAKALTRAELARLLDELPERWRPFHELLAETGLRVSEALGLEWPDVEFGARPRLRVRRQFYRGTLKRLKSSNGRRDLPLSEALARKLWTARPADGEEPVFATRNGTRLLDRNVRRVLDKATERAGVEWASFHTFRHTCASLLFDSGRNHPAGLRLARPRRPRVHAADLRPPDRRRARRAAGAGCGAAGGRDAERAASSAKAA